ncbi:unnamed protein product, partial [Polarella glacialis]
LGVGLAEPRVLVRVTAAIAAVRPLSSRTVLFLDVGEEGGELQQICLRADLCGVQKVRDLEVVRQGLARGKGIRVLGCVGKTGGGRDDGLTVFATHIETSISEAELALSAASPVEMLEDRAFTQDVPFL